MLAADGRESQHHVKAGGGLLHCRREGRKRIAVFEFPALPVTHAALNAQAMNVLVAIGLRQGNPKMGGTRGIRVSGNMHQIREFERTRWNSISHFRSSSTARISGDHGHKSEPEH